MNAQVQLICMSASLVITSVEKKHNENPFYPFLARPNDDNNAIDGDDHSRSNGSNGSNGRGHDAPLRARQLELVPYLLELLFYASDDDNPGARNGAQRFLSYVETQHEVSIVFEEELLAIFPRDALEFEPIRWRALQVASAGTGAFLSQLAVLQELTSQLAKHHISVFQISTYQTDYVLVKVEELDKAISCLRPFCEIEMESGESYDEWKVAQEPKAANDVEAVVEQDEGDNQETHEEASDEVDPAVDITPQQHLLSVPDIDLFLIQIEKAYVRRHMYSLVRLLFGRSQSMPSEDDEPTADGAGEDGDAHQRRHRHPRGKLFLSYSETGDDISVVTYDTAFVEQMQQLAMAGDQGVIVSPDAWKVVQIGDKKLGFSETGIVAGQTRVLLNAGTMVFYLSTYATDFMMIKEDEWDDALQSLRVHSNVLEGRFAPLTDAIANPSAMSNENDVGSIAPTPLVPSVRDAAYKEMAHSAQDRAKATRLGQGRKSVWQSTMTDVGKLGLGVQLYFLLLKYLTATFAIMALLSVPAIVINNHGRGITDRIADPMGMAYRSLGNDGVNPDYLRDKVWCKAIDCNWTTILTPLTKNPYTASWIITLSDVAYSIVLIAFVIRFHVVLQRIVDAHELENITPAQYAVFVRGLPRDASEREVLDHFNAHYDPTQDETYYPLWFGCLWGRQQLLDNSPVAIKADNRSVVTDVDHLGDNVPAERKEMYIGSWIAEVSIAHPTGGLLSAFLAMEALTSQISELQELVTNLKHDQALLGAAFPVDDVKFLAASQDKLTKLQETFEERQHSAAACVAGSDACECAFVVFNNLESRRRCLQDYRKSTRWLARVFQPKALQFRGRHALIVRAAPEPSNILWENLEVTDVSRRLRRLVTAVLTLLLLLVCCAIISTAQSAQQTFKSKLPPPDLCSDYLPEVFYGNATDDDMWDEDWTLEWYRNETCTPDEHGARYYIAYTNDEVNPVSVQTPAAIAPPPVRCLDPCISPTHSNITCSTIECFDQKTVDGEDCVHYNPSHVLYCYCMAEMSDIIKEEGFFSGPRKLLQNNPPCRGYIRDYLTKNVLIIVAAVSVVVVNMLLKSILRTLTAFESHSSESSRAAAIVTKLFASQLINTAVIVLIFRDFEREWYATVGVAISTTMLINIALPHVTELVTKEVLPRVVRVVAGRPPRTRQQLDRIFAGATFDLTDRYPLVLNSVFVTLMFCGGAPILLFIAAATSFVTFWVDKLVLTYFYSIKVAYDPAIGRSTLRLLPWALAMHLAFSMWMYGNDSMMRTTTVNVQAAIDVLGLKHAINVTRVHSAQQLYNEFAEKAAQSGIVGTFVTKVVHANSLLMFVLFVLVTVGILVSTAWQMVVWPLIMHALDVLLSRWAQSTDARVVPMNGHEPLATKLAHNLTHRVHPEQRVAVPEFTAEFQKSATQSFQPDNTLGFEKTADGVIVRVRRSDSVIDGRVYKAGDRLRTWEAMDAPCTSYAIDRNPKYRFAVAQLQAAASVANNVT
ncbi:TPA: hypothetical protein N0F65_005402 [Lagenidium giganteum]|uniref:CASTOR ACT domain-containing protein n=1 Tax=Lagenidium giganteum TaxID=4803 RepID=A0AAV2YX26_9STRA|nr:TPA: hypothetical protein N0F65_005402 [Lagenidium giganteum]